MRKPETKKNVEAQYASERSVKLTMMALIDHGRGVSVCTSLHRCGDSVTLQSEYIGPVRFRTASMCQCTGRLGASDS